MKSAFFEYDINIFNSQNIEEAILYVELKQSHGYTISKNGQVETTLYYYE